MNTLSDDIRKAINYHSAENGSNTPDSVLADFLIACLAAFDAGVNRRAQWYGREDYPGRAMEPPEPPK